MSDRDSAQLIELIRSITSCQQRAAMLGLGFLADLLSAAAIEAAMQWNPDGTRLGNANTRLDELLRLKLVIALGKSEHELVPFLASHPPAEE